MKTQCTDLRKVVQEKKKSIREVKTTLEVFKKKGEREVGQGGREGEKRETETESVIRREWLRGLGEII